MKSLTLFFLVALTCPFAIATKAVPVTPIATEVYVDCMLESKALVVEDYSFEVCDRLPESRECEITKRSCALTRAIVKGDKTIAYKFMCYPPASGFLPQILYRVNIEKFDGQSCDLEMKVLESWDD